MAFARKLVGAARLPGVAWSFSRLGYRGHARSFADADLDVSLAGKHCVVTGANAGIGFAIAEALARRHADVWMLCRDPDRGRAAHQQIAELGAGRAHLEIVDLAERDSIDALLARIEAPAIDVLVHNAGALVHERTVTRDDVELTLAVHVVGPHRLTRGLLERLRRAESPRVVWMSSGGMYSEPLDVDALLDPPEPFDGVRAYALAKRAQVELAELWAEREPAIGFYAMHPGWVDTEGVSSALPGFYRATRRWLRTPAEGADTAVWLAAAPELPVPSGAFVFDRAEARRHMLPGTRAEPDERERLWREAERLATGGSRP